MSSLLGLRAPIAEQVVKVSDSEGFAVRGLSPYHVVALYRRHASELEPLFERVMAGAQDQPAADIEAVVMSLAMEAPSILAELIALASGGDPSDTTKATILHPVSGDDVALPSFDAAVLLALHLPFPVQTDALDKIIRLTFTSEMPAGKFLALVTSMATKVTSAIQAPQL